MLRIDGKKLATHIQLACDAAGVANWDANESVWFARELEHMLGRVVNVKFEALKARELIPVNTEADPADETITYEVWEELGLAKIIAHASNDIPRVDVKATLVSSVIKMIAVGWGWTIKEAMKARKTGKPLNEKKATAARKAALREENRIAWLGDTDHNLPGLLTNANKTEFTLPADGAGASKLFSTKTPDQIARDLHSIANTPFTTSKGVFTGDTMLVSLAIWTLITTTRMPDGDTVVLDFFLKSNAHIKNVTWLNELTDLGAGNTDQIFVYNRNPESVEMHVPEDFTAAPPQPKGLEFEVPAYQQTGGTIVYEPLTLAFADGAA